MLVGFIIWGMWGLIAGIIAGIVGFIIGTTIIDLILNKIDEAIFGREFVEQMEERKQQMKEREQQMKERKQRMKERKQDIELNIRNIRDKEKKNDVEGLIKILQYDNDWGVKGDAAQTLGELGDEKAVESLIQVLFTRAPVNTLAEAKKVVDAQDKIVDALVTIGAPAVNPLIHVLKESGSDEIYIQKKATEVLQRIGVDLNSI